MSPVTWREPSAPWTPLYRLNAPVLRPRSPSDRTLSPARAGGPPVPLPQLILPRSPLMETKPRLIHTALIWPTLTSPSPSLTPSPLTSWGVAVMLRLTPASAAAGGAMLVGCSPPRGPLGGGGGAAPGPGAGLVGLC